ncbi:hypothetical protein BKA63DRAFT_528438 [Paraphoma chrysanthemicola]|nr:hypothetical protein BKA63DRAFT_528438 [Paraphoma chrysanthemicola]
MRVGCAALLAAMLPPIRSFHAVFNAAALQPRRLHAALNVLPRLPRSRPDATLSPNQLQPLRCRARLFAFDRPVTVIAIHHPSTCLPREGTEKLSCRTLPTRLPHQASCLVCIACACLIPTLIDASPEVRRKWRPRHH